MGLTPPKSRPGDPTTSTVEPSVFCGRVTFMAELDRTNNSDALTNDSLHYPEPSFPAWVPAFTVAVAMITFLAGSFYIRHRKVVKKRQILMDYFYIIFQYGGLRRKRMVAALCNTNAITLRELGRSFMISFDSIANSDNSCPFYPEDTSFTQGSSLTPNVHKKTFFRNRGMISTKKARGPFRRYNTQSDESQGPNPVSLQDILMRFKTKRPGVTSPTPIRSRPKNQRLEGSSMCAIHGDEYEYESYIEENEEPQFNRQRRNAYVDVRETCGLRFADVVTEVGRHSLGNVMADSTVRTPSPYPGKRNSEPWHNVEGCAYPDLSSCAAQNPRVFQLNNERLSPSNVVCGSHGYIPRLSEARSLGSSAGAYRNSEPTILIHPASTDVDPTQGWSDIRSRYTNGIVFLKRVPKGDGSTGEYFYEEQTDPQLDRARRASLSKVSYVPSGNMNEYYNCLTSPKKTKVELPKLDTASDSRTPTKSCPGLTLGPSRTKRSRLSLGEIAISNFNKRIDIASESHESAPESSMESKGSQESASNPQHSKYRSTWMKFKNVFTTSRSSHSSGSQQSKSGKSMSVVEERHRRRGRHVDSRWKRFVSVFTGFRSLPETKLSSHSLDCPKCSSSVPSGLDLADKKCPFEKCNSVDVESGIGLTDMNISRVSLINERVTDPVENFHTLDRPKSLRLPTHAQSVPEELINLRNFNQLFKNPERVNEPTNPLDASILPRRYRKRCNPIDASSLSLPQSKKDFRTYIFQSGGLNSPGETRSRVLHRDLNTPPSQMASPCSSDGHFYSRRFRNLSPLPETCIGGCQKTCGSRSPSLTADADNVSEKSVYLTPSHLNADKDLFFELTGYSNEIGRDTAARDRSLSNDRLSFIKMTFFDLCSARKISSETDLSTKCSRIDVNDFPLRSRESKNYSDHNDCIITFDIKPAQTDSSSSIHNELSWNSHGNSQVAPSHLTTNTPMEASPRVELNHLTVDHRQIAQSCDSVYYDSLSAVGTPCLKSPQDFHGSFTETEAHSFADVEPSPGRSPSLRLDDVNTRPSSSGKNSLFSEPLSTPNMSRAPTPTPTESKLSSPFASRTPSPCLFWQNSPREISNSSNNPQLAKPTPTRNDCPKDALGLPPQVTHLVSSSLTKETRFAFRPAVQDNGPTFAPTTKSNGIAFTSTTTDTRLEFTPFTKDNRLAFTPTTKDNYVALKPATCESLAFTPTLNDKGLTFSTPNEECCRLLSSTEERSHRATHQISQISQNSSLGEHDPLLSGSDHAECTTQTAVSPRGSRNPTPTRSFSTPSPSFDKTSGSYVLPEESYRANVSRLPRFARRASQGTPVHCVPSQDVMQAKMGNLAFS